MPDANSLRRSSCAPFTLHWLWEEAWGRGPMQNWDRSHPFHSSLKSPRRLTFQPTLLNTDREPRASGFAALCLGFPTCKMGPLWELPHGILLGFVCGDHVCRATAGVHGGPTTPSALSCTTWSSPHGLSWEPGILTSSVISVRKRRKGDREKKRDGAEETRRGARGHAHTVA